MVYLSALALAYRTLLILWTTTIASDSTYYLLAARSFSQGLLLHALTDHHGLQPLYPLTTATLGTLLGNLETAAYAISAGASSLAVIPLYFLARRVWNPRVAFWSGLIYALHPMLSLEGSEVRYTGLFLALFLTALALGTAALRGSNWALYPLMGLAAGLCYLARPEAVYLLGFAAIEAILKVVRLLRKGTPDRERWAWTRFLGGVAVAAVLGGFLALPYYYWVEAKTGRRLTSRTAADAFQGNPPPAPTPAPVAPSPSPAPVEVLPADEPGESPGTHSLGSFLGRSALKFSRSLYWPLGLLAVLGVIFARSQGATWRELGPSLGMTLAICLPPLILCWRIPQHPLSLRYFLPAVTLLLPCAAAGFLTVLDFCSRRFTLRWRTVPVPALLLTGFLVGILLGKFIGPRRSDEIAFREAGAWLKGQGRGQRGFLLTSSEKIAYYGDCLPVTLPRPAKAPGPESVSEAVRRATQTYRAQGASYLAIDDQSLRHYYGSGYLEELERAGFERSAEFRGSRSPSLTVWIYHRKAANP